MPVANRRQPRPIIKPAAIVLKDRKLLVVRTVGRSHYFALGGKLEKGETEIECLRREVQEEVGCGITNLQYYATFAGPSTDKPKFVVMLCYRVELDREPRPCSEIESILWANTASKELIGSLLTEHIMPALAKDGLID
jgi:8-oxo-dGTP pyrophosphatase MutT (NUDIX family)